MLKFYITLLLLLPLSAVAQFTITGKVLDREDKKPVANASVFLSNATNGTASARERFFRVVQRKSRQVYTGGVGGWVWAFQREYTGEQ